MGERPVVEWDLIVQTLKISSLARGEIADDRSREVGINLLGGRLNCLKLPCAITGGNVLCFIGWVTRFTFFVSKGNIMDCNIMAIHNGNPRQKLHN